MHPLTAHAFSAGRILCLLVLLAGQVGAVFYENEPLFLLQPDGTRVEVRVWGDEFYQHVETPDGHTLIRDLETDWICYADIKADGMALVSTGRIYSDSQQITLFTTEKSISPVALPPRKVRLKPEAIRQKVAKARAIWQSEGPEPVVTISDLKPASTANFSTKAGRTRGEPEAEEVLGLTLLIEFPDESATITKEEVDAYLNQPGYNKNKNQGSVYDFFNDVSDGRLIYTNIVVDYFTAPNNKTYYSKTEGYKPLRELLVEALEHLESRGFDFSQLTTDGSNHVRALNVLYAGGPDSAWGEGLWPHMGWLSGQQAFKADGVRLQRYQITSMGKKLTLRTFCHESGHLVCGWPDLYDYDRDSAGAGRYCLMASGGSSTNPLPPCPYLRDQRDWETIIDLTDAMPGMRYTHNANSLTTYRYSHPVNPREYYLIESRQRTGRHATFPDAGLVVWHIDEDGHRDSNDATPTDHFKVSLKQADGFLQLERNQNRGGAGDLFHAGYRDRFSDRTLPPAKWWSGDDSGLVIADISAAGEQMSFQIGHAPQPLARWALEGDLRDSSQQGHDAVLVQGGRTDDTWWREGVWNPQRQQNVTALALNGQGDHVLCDSITDSVSQCTMALWLKSEGAARAVLVDKMPDDDSGQGWRLVINEEGTLTLAIGSGERHETVTTVFPVVNPGRWFHLTATFKEGTARLYIDGWSVAQSTDIATSVADSQSPLRLGSDATETAGFTGLLSDVFLFDVAYTPEQIRSLPGVAGFAARVLGAWGLDETDGSQVTDRSTYASHGKLKNRLSYARGHISGVIDGALTLDGQRDYIEIDSIVTPGREVTLAGWFFWEDLQEPYTGLIFSRDRGTVAGLHVTPGRRQQFLGYHWAERYYQIQTYLELPRNQWVYAALSVQPENALLLVHDGVAAQTFTHAAEHPWQSFRGDLHLGRDRCCDERYLDGALDEILMYNWALNEEELEAVMWGERACCPQPADRFWAVTIDRGLNWQSRAIAFDVYLGTELLSVTHAQPGDPEHLGRLMDRQVSPDLAVPETYFWRVDSITDRGTILPGPVWTFATRGSLTRERWTDVVSRNVEVTTLTHRRDFPDSPHRTESLYRFETPNPTASEYGGRIHGYLVPQTSGSYTFWIAGDDKCELWLSPSDDPKQARLIASVSSYTSPYDWDENKRQKSRSTRLEAGQAYYIKALHVQGRGADHVSVAWQGPDSPERSVIDGLFLRPFNR